MAALLEPGVAFWTVLPAALLISGSLVHRRRQHVKYRRHRFERRRIDGVWRWSMTRPAKRPRREEGSDDFSGASRAWGYFAMPLLLLGLMAAGCVGGYIDG